MTDNHYVTRFGSLNAYERGRVESIADDVRHYALSNCFDIAAKSQPWEKVVCGQNQIYVLETLRADGVDGDWAVAATAHPAKFESVVEPLLGHAVEVPPALAEMLARPAQATPVPPEYAALQAHLLD